MGEVDRSPEQTSLIPFEDYTDVRCFLWNIMSGGLFGLIYDRNPGVGFEVIVLAVRKFKGA